MLFPRLATLVPALLLFGCSDGAFPSDALSSSSSASSPALSGASDRADLSIRAPLVTSCAGASTLSGVDVSTYQGTIDWTRVKGAGISFAIAKATESTNLVDAQFAANWAGMKAAGVVRAAYHFFDPAVDAASQVDYCLATVGALEADDLPVVLDFEQLNGVSEAEAVADAVTFLAGVTAKTGKTAILYMSSDFLSGSYPALAPYLIWVANYGVTCPGLPSEWSRWDFWQHGDTGTVSGISGDVDVDTFNGTAAALGAVAGSAAAADAGSGEPSDGGESADAGAHHSDAGSHGGGDDAGSVVALDSGTIQIDQDAAAPAGGSGAVTAQAAPPSSSAACSLSGAPRRGTSPFALLAAVAVTLGAWQRRSRSRSRRR